MQDHIPSQELYHLNDNTQLQTQQSQSRELVLLGSYDSHDCNAQRSHFHTNCTYVSLPNQILEMADRIFYLSATHLPLHK